MPSSHPPIRRAWWKESTIYQIYPASFKDSTGTGMGDIPGIISKLDYIKDLGVDIVWLSPVLKSPQVDMGYDISDYSQIDSLYGTMADHDSLIQGLHSKGLKYIMDLVVNHTSNEHEWFKKSRASKEGNEYRDWYIWRPAKYDSDGNRMPPNNWESAFSGSAWTWDENTQEYYLHLFASSQPDLNWENPHVVGAVHKVIRFWLDKGVDGFRMDVINFISKSLSFPNGPITKPGFLQSGAEHYACGPRLHEFLQGMGATLKEYNAFSVGEMPGVNDSSDLIKAVGQDRGELAMAFQFDIVGMDSDGSKWTPRPFQISTLKTIVEKWQSFMIANGGWNALFMENHDQSRTISRYASEEPAYRALSGKMIATHLALLSGTINVPADWPIEKYKDTEFLNYWKSVLKEHPDDHDLQQRTLKRARLVLRDNARTPMQWNAKSNAGFALEGSTAEPWMDVHPDYKEWNAEKQVGDKRSNYNYWRQLLELRKREKDVFVYGDFEMIEGEGEGSGDVVAYLRTAEDGKQKSLVVTSFSAEEVDWRIPKQKMEGGKVVIRNYEDGESLEDGKLLLRPFEALVLVA